MRNREMGSEQPQNLFERLKAEQPERNVAFTAIEQLKDENEIREFFEQYATWQKENAVENPDAVARENIGYILGYYDKKTADRWMKALPDVSHPVFGKDIPFSDAKRAFEAGREQGQGEE